MWPPCDLLGSRTLMVSPGHVGLVMSIGLNSLASGPWEFNVCASQDAIPTGDSCLPTWHNFWIPNNFTARIWIHVRGCRRPLPTVAF